MEMKENSMGKNDLGNATSYSACQLEKELN